MFGFNTIQDWGGMGSLPALVVDVSLVSLFLIETLLGEPAVPHVDEIISCSVFD
jgi:hypothetical protein